MVASPCLLIHLHDGSTSSRKVYCAHNMTSCINDLFSSPPSPIHTVLLFSPCFLFFSSSRPVPSIVVASLHRLAPPTIKGHRSIPEGIYVLLKMVQLHEQKIHEVIQKCTVITTLHNISNILGNIQLAASISNFDVHQDNL